MRRDRFALMALMILPVPAVAQAPSDEALRAGARVARAVIDPFPVSFSRGDSVSVRIGLVDSTGGDITGAQWFLQSEPGPIAVSTADTTADAREYVFKGETAARQSFWIAVARPGAGGRVDTARVDSLVAEAGSSAVARLEIVAPEYSAYTGTTMQLRARAFAADSTELDDVRISWETDDPCHTRLLPDGAVTFGAPTKVTITARSQGVTATREFRISNNPVRTVEMSPKSARTRVGDVLKFRIGASDGRGVDVDDVALSYTVAALDSGRGRAHIDSKGAFVAEQMGNYLVRVTAGTATAEALVEVGRRPAPSPVQLVGRGTITGTTSRGLAVFGGSDQHDYAYTGSGRGRVYVWDVSDPLRIALVDSVQLDAEMAGDIRVNLDGSLAVVSRTGGPVERNGITVLDLAVPAHPRVLANFSENLAGGVGATWLFGSYLFAVNEGVGALDIVDLAVPAQPRYVGRWETRPGEPKKLHDVWGDDKNLYLAHGSDGLVILDITDDGRPTAPKMLSQLKWKDANAHSVTRAGRYVYIGEERVNCEECVNGPRGAVRVVDVSKLKEPFLAARYEVPEAGADQLSVDNNTLFVGYRQGGLRILDVTGEMRGDIYRQGRQAGWFVTAPRGAASMTSYAIPFKGLLYVVDENTGLWVVRHQKASRLTP